MADQKELTPVPFHGDTIYAVDHNGEPYAAMRPIIENMGLAWWPQMRKLKRQEDRWGVTILMAPSEGGPQQTLCIPVRKLAGFLATINHNKVRNELRSKVLAYQRECDDVLWDYWTGGVNRETGFDSGFCDWDGDFDAIDDGGVSANQRIRLLSLSIKFAALSPSERKRALEYFGNFCKQAANDAKNGKGPTRQRGSNVPDHMRRFVMDRCEVGSERQVTKDNLYDCYRAFCLDEEIPPLSKFAFFRHLYAITKARPVRYRDPLATEKEDSRRTMGVVGVGLN